MHRKEFIHSIIPQIGKPKNAKVSVFAPINIALIKYWGKRNAELMVPYNTSLSVTLNRLGTKTCLSISDEDELSIDSKVIDKTSDKHKRVFDFLHLICGNDIQFHVETENNIPIASGLASSASAFASLALAVNALFNLQLPKETLSKIARIGSISAGRSLHDGFVLLDHSDTCHAKPIDTQLDDFCIGFCIVSDEEKKFKSRDNMEHTVLHSVFYDSWLQIVERDLHEIIPFIQTGNFYDVGKIAERNALCMHASIAMLNEVDRFYLRRESLAIIKNLQALRKEGLDVFCTVDAGPNVKLLFQHKNLEQIQKAVPEMSFYEKVL